MTLDDVYSDLLRIVSRAGAQVDEEFFAKQLAMYSGSKEQFLSFVEQNIFTWFACLDKSPEWIQEANWQFSNGEPMFFLGQINIGAEKGIYHDDAACFVFVNLTTGETKSVIQVA